MNDSRVEARNLIDIKSAGLISLDNKSLVRSDYNEQGEIGINSKDFTMKGNSGLLGSSRIDITAENRVNIIEDSYLRISSKETKLIPKYKYNV